MTMTIHDNKHTGDTPGDRQEAYAKLASWLQHLLTTPPPGNSEALPGDTLDELEQEAGNDYHLRYYQQLPDFVMALLQNDPRATVRYAPLLYHLASCAPCREAYRDFYMALREALKADEGLPQVDYGTRPLATIPSGSLVHLSQQLIRQAEAVLRQARRDHTDGSDAARSLLQLAMRFSAQLTQSSMRSRALQDLVRVATLYDGAQEPPVHTYSPLVGAGRTRHGGGARRKAGAALPPAEQAAIYLRSQTLAGRIIQQQDVLELHLQNLDASLRGHYLIISVPLGSLFEPVQWIGGDPRAIRSANPVDQQGRLITPLGRTDLRLTNQDDRNLLEVTFHLLEVRPADQPG